MGQVRKPRYIANKRTLAI